MPMGRTQQAGRRTRQELKALMIEAGQELFADIEPTMGFENLTYKRVFEHLLASRGDKVTIGSVHERIWPRLRDYQLDVLAAVLRSVPEQAFDVSSSGVLEWFETADLVSPAGRRYAAQNVTRLFGNLAWGDGRPLHAHEATAYDARFRTWILGDDHPEASQIRDLVTESRAASHRLYLDSMRLLMAAIDLRERSHVRGLGTDLVAIIGNGVTVGLLTDTLPQARAPHLLPTGRGGEDEVWHVAAIAMWAGVQSLLELGGDGLTDDERRL